MKIIEGQTDSVPIGESGNSDPPISLFKIKVKRNEFYEHVEYEIIESWLIDKHISFLSEYLNDNINRNDCKIKGSMEWNNYW